MKKLIWINPKGGYGNRALQYLAACGIQKRVPQAVITNIHLKELGLESPATRPSARGNISVSQANNRLDLDWIERRLNDPRVRSLTLDNCWAQHLDNFPTRDECREIIPRIAAAKNAEGFGPEYLVCNVRAAEILNGVHSGYIPLPPEYYRMLAEKTGLKLVFYGQLGDDAYSANLRRLFADSPFIESQGLATDFETLRNSTNIAIGVSTFSWLAAWLSKAERIFLPVCGIFNQAQFHYHNFLPFNDQAYSFILFPVTHCIDIRQNADAFFDLQKILARDARWIEKQELQDLCSRRSDWLKKLSKHSRHHLKVRQLSPRPKIVDFLDIMYYAEKLSYLIYAVKHGPLEATRRYRSDGNAYGYGHLLLDQARYFQREPKAGMEISEGKYFDVYHHFAENRQRPK